MVKVKAVVNGKGRLFSGMNVRVNVHRSLGKQFVIPKSAVVLRSGKQVVFTLKKGVAGGIMCKPDWRTLMNIHWLRELPKRIKLRKETRLS